jgi:O-antigen biosynthesis protein
VTAVAIPLSTLRAQLDTRSAPASWSVDIEGVPGRALVQPAGSLISFPLRLGGPARLRARVMLLPREWRDGSGHIDAAVTVADGTGEQRRLWSGRLAAAAESGDADGQALECELPAASTALMLDATCPTPGDSRAVARLLWTDAGMSAFDGAPPLSPSAPLAAPVASRADARRTPSRPLISVLTPVHDPPIEMLDEAIASVRVQTFADWELCLIDDGSRNPEVIGALERHAAEDCRIRCTRRSQAGGIAAATNAAIRLATGEYIALLDHDDTLAPDALQLVAETIEHDPSLDMIYSDEDIVTGQERIWLHLKPAWSPDTLNTNGYTCHLGVYRRSLVESVGGFRSEFNGSQDVDMILRLAERTDRIAHVPHVLYHWRAHAASTAGGDAKPYAYVAARRAISEHLARGGASDARVEYGPPGLYRVEYRVDPSLPVTVAVATGDARGLRQMGESLRGQEGVAWQLVVSAPSAALADCAAELRAGGLEADQLIVIAGADDADPSRSLAAAAAVATTDHIVLVDQPAVGLTHDWLRRLVGYSSQPSIGAAGALVLAPDGRVMHGGVALPEGIPLFLLHGQRPSMDDHFGYGTSVYNVSALSGVVATRKDVFVESGGLPGELRELALIDYCLRATAGRLRAVVVPDARVRAVGSDRTTNDLAGMLRMRTQWLSASRRDPFYNPNFRTDCGDFVPIASA